MASDDPTPAGLKTTDAWEESTIAQMPPLDAVEQKMVREGYTIGAIKHYRERFWDSDTKTGPGLKATKEKVDAYADELNLPGYRIPRLEAQVRDLEERLREAREDYERVRMKASELENTVQALLDHVLPTVRKLRL
jgi:chromosome segregation ATPase